ncbi:MAG TPA: pilus assembly protein PilM [Solirubrobacteraceae bacterium]|nr:pilus assembly protein PilM [Solirubrobacteraceae bacterium]
MPPFNINLNLKLGRRGGGTVVGLDIQPGYVAAVEARVNGSILVQRAVGAPLAADTVREGEVLDEGALSSTLRDLFENSDLGKRVRIGVANQRTVLRTLELPPVTDAKELAAAVRFQAEDQVPMPLGNAVLDFQPLGVFDTPNGPRQRVILVAAQRDMVERLLSAVREAGLRPEGVDLSAFALIRSLYRADADDAGRVLYLNVGGLTNMAIAEGTVCRFTRVVGGGLEAMAAEVAERRSIPLTDARLLLSSIDLTAEPAVAVAPAPVVPAAEQEPAPVVEPDPSDADADSESSVAEHEPEAQALDPDAQEPATADQDASEPTAALDEPDSSEAPPAEPASVAVSPPVDIDADVRTVLENGVREIAGEVRNSLDFHRSQEGGGDVSTVVLSGPALEIAGFAEMLEADLGVQVRRETVRAAQDGAFGQVSAEHLAIAAGLAAEEVHA